MKRFDGLRGAENRPPQRMAFQNAGEKSSWTRSSGRVLDHLDLFENHALFALDLLGANAGCMHHVGEQIDGKRHVLVEDFDVIAAAYSLAVKASSWPPIESIACAMSSALRVPVPLNSMCSTKWAMPPRSSVSCREPRVSHTPIVTDRTCGIVSVMSRSPPLSTSRTTMSVEDRPSPAHPRHRVRRVAISH